MEAGTRVLGYLGCVRLGVEFRSVILEVQLDKMT